MHRAILQTLKIEPLRHLSATCLLVGVEHTSIKRAQGNESWNRRFQWQSTDSIRSISSRSKVQDTLDALPRFAVQSRVASAAVTLVTCIAPAITLGISYARGPGQFTKQVDRSTTKFPAIPGLHSIHKEVNGLKIHVVTNHVEPSSTKPLMLFLHGFPEFWFSWWKQLREFQKDYHVAAIDMRGYGESDKPKDVASYTLDKLASDVKGVVNALGYQSCILVAHDWGGCVAQAAALQHPEVVEKLVVMGTMHLGLWRSKLDWTQFGRSWYIWAFQAPYLAEAILSSNDCAALHDVFLNPENGGVPGLMPVEDLNRYKQAWQRPGAATAALNYYRALLTYPEGSKIMDSGPIRQRTLFLHGTNDHAISSTTLLSYKDVFQDLSLVMLPGCSHWIPKERPAEVNGLIRAFLEGKPLPQVAKTL